MDDLYKVLQVDPQADVVVIRAAYHALARMYHPDAGGDLKRMVQINAAWAVLGDLVSRSVYDGERARPQEPSPTVGPADSDARRERRGGVSPLPARRDSTTTLDFGRYAGWSLGQVVQQDPDYLEWVVRTPIGRRLAAEIKMLLEGRAAARNPVAARPRERAWTARQWFGARSGR
jgi:curved DNA-binding protein CbpA